MKYSPRVKESERGSSFIEFALCSVVWLPLLLGVIFVGVDVTRSIEVTQVCRDAGHMHAYGVDFSQPANQSVLVRLAAGFSMTPTGGNGLFLLSTVMAVGPEQCAAGGLQPDSAGCPNINRVVFTRRVLVGNASLRASSFGTPRQSFMDAAGNIGSAGYLKDSAARVSGLPPSIVLTPGQNAYIAEACFTAPGLSWTNPSSAAGLYSSFIF